MIDTAVFDVSTAKLLFRAPGTFRQQRNATLMDNTRDLRKLRQEGFAGATDDMIVNLDGELAQFQDGIKQGERAQVAWRSGYGGGGSISWQLLVLVLLIVLGIKASGRRL
jgi:rhombotail lipoprotein